MDNSPDSTRFSGDKLAQMDNWKLASTERDRQQSGARTFVYGKTKKVRHKTVRVFAPVTVTDSGLVIYKYGPSIHTRPLPATYAEFLAMLRDIHAISKKMYTRQGNFTTTGYKGWEGARQTYTGLQQMSTPGIPTPRQS